MGNSERLPTMSEEIITKDNRLIGANYQLTLVEQRVLLSCLAQVDSRNRVEQSESFEVLASNIVDMVGDDGGNTYRDLKRAIDRLFERKITYQENGQTIKLRWIWKATYAEKEGKVTIFFSPDILPYISELSARFTSYKLEHVAKFKTVHSLRIYELLTQWTSRGTKEIELDELRRILCISYPNFKDLRRDVIQPAVAEINKHSNLWVEVGYRSMGRKKTHVQFSFGIKGQDKQPNTPKRLTDAQIAAAARPGESKAQVIARLRGDDLAKIAKPGETVDQAQQRKKALAEAKKSLRGKQ